MPGISLPNPPVLKQPFKTKVTALGNSFFRFGITSSIATAVDFALFRFLFIRYLSPFYSELCSAFIGMVINFFMQKQFVFVRKRKVHYAFFLSILFSFAVMYLGALFIKLLYTDPFLAKHPGITKLIIIGSKFVVNFLSKKWVFEKRI
jgi:putative flippase GtrA